MKVLFDAIKTKFDASPHNDFYNDMSGRFYLDKGPQNATFPYCVYTLISEVPNWLMGNQNTETVLIQFTIFSIESSAINIESYYSHLKTLFDDCQLTVTGFRTLWMKRENSRILQDDRPAWCRSVDYRVYLEKI